MTAPATDPPRPLVLYSTNTHLAFMVSRLYYRDLHYVWCSPYPGSAKLAAFDRVEPASSSPLKLYRDFHDDVTAPDLHSARILQNRGGLIRGAAAKKSVGAIDDTTETEIATIVKNAEIGFFRPWLYIIPFAAVAGLAKRVPLVGRAHPFSEEYIIEELPRACFDIVDLPL